MYKQAKGYYEEAKGKNNISDDKKIQLMLENIWTSISLAL